VRYLVTIWNSSSQPIYQVIVRWHDGSAPWMIDGEDTDQLNYVMSDQEKEISRMSADGGNRAARGAVMELPMPLECNGVAGRTVSWRSYLLGELPHRIGATI
jgi:hypothetical protein